MCRVQIKASFPRHWIIHCHSNNRVSLTEAKICCDQISKLLLTPTAFWGSNFKPLDQLPVKIKKPWKCGVLTWDPPRLCNPGSRHFHAQMIYNILGYSPVSTCCSSSSLTPPQLTGHLVNPSALPSVRSCVRLPASASHHCQTSRKTPFHLSLCTNLPRSTSQGLVRGWKQHSGWGSGALSPDTVCSFASCEMIIAARVLVVSGLGELKSSKTCNSYLNCVGLAQERQS